MTGARMTWRMVAGLAVLAAASGPAVVRAQTDRVRLTDRSELQGEIVSTTPVDIDINDVKSGEVKKVPVDRIRDVLLNGEPPSLKNARGMLSRQDPAAALEELDKIEKPELEGVGPLVLAELDFVRAASIGRKAAASGAGLDAAEKALQAFLKKHPQSFRRFRIEEILGDVLVGAGKFDEAAAAYATLEKGPPALQIRAASAKAAVYYEQRAYDKALAEFDRAAAVATDAQDVASARQKREAALGRARCLARTGKAADAVGIAQEVIHAADVDDAELLGRAYNTLGDAYRALGDKDQDAIISFLTVEAVYNGLPESHAEALSNLVELWEKVNRPERSREARQVLEGTYPDSPWTRKLTGAAGAS